ncbi:hypothetical protein [Bythopirellula polymerisocia]|uniref:YXWGXW repeat (2 copies) n=1 Tax=Bythopirellula polymerisocia TaxID=2528003 RepID=A0A5C6CYN3_9BACT|nr:hypothetical protein [Bythopirellula polymerisocia]TWU29680.1 hypothetical protein Pla144_04590 [Bythopirellula polymerisocia]
MSRISISLGGLLLTSLVALSAIQIASAQAPPIPGQQNMLPDPEVLDQGPIHEAFAEPLAFEQEEAEVVTKQPPAPVQELPPDERPEGKNVEWIPGYFKFDRDRNDFVWVSGLWRDVPPGRTWIPGEWQEVDGGWQWVHGFWSDADQELRLLPIPPASLEAGPSSPAPGDNYSWAPGCWNWQNTGYAWQAGFWYEAQPNWVWIPNHYSYTPTGCIYVNGYWDYPPQSRGWLYAPVYWGGGYAGYGGNYYYRPRSVINTGLLLANLFVNNRYGGYYYGYNYGRHPNWISPWGANYGKWGNYGHTGQGKGHHGRYDPLWAYNRGNNHDRNHRGDDHQAGNFNRGDHRDGDFTNGRDRQGGKLVTSVEDFKKDYQKSGGNNRKVRQLSDTEVAKVQSQAKKYANYDRSRIGLEANSAADLKTSRDGNRAKFDGSKTAQGRILRQGDGGSLQGDLRKKGSVDVRNQGQGSRDIRSGGDIEARISGSNQAEIKRGQRDSDLRSNTQLQRSARMKQDGKSIDLGASNQSPGSVNQRYKGTRQGDGSAQSGRQQLYYRGSPNQSTNGQQLNQQQQQQFKQRQQNVPNTRTLQNGLPQNVNPQGAIRRSGTPDTSNMRSYQGNARGQGAAQSTQRSIQPTQRNFAPQSRGAYRGGGGNPGGGNQAIQGNRGGGGGGNQASGGNRGGRGGGGHQGGGKKGR